MNTPANGGTDQFKRSPKAGDRGDREKNRLEKEIKNLFRKQNRVNKTNSVQYLFFKKGLF